MDPEVLGKKYDNIAGWWQDQHNQGEYGLKSFRRALQIRQHALAGGSALDVGCGAGGRFVRELESQGYQVTGVDVSAEMIRLARRAHPNHQFLNQDICRWETDDRFDFIFAWDSLFHLPLAMHEPVLSKLCGYLNVGGTLLYTFGDAVGDHEDQWHNDSFYYSSIGIEGNLRLLMDNGLLVQHLELDQYPQPHVYVVASRPTPVKSAD